ncbi:MarR family winged helix-turn-helix transcriptional regulator [Streptomyces griseocarneus]|uniref:MarR family winged helix-turn-helix transcriptional regulator n=1 Tax=Streptomyces griseocarneus TaxID=51201 RepID=UPI00167C87A7|nr:MarR family transcriptional regulator [Streptomyces griseocarneus]MBZ6477776.1 MarR family transcriptional regulator [Streptomyces griseocarneus]GHG61135.1 MarR family transcriptional regulator [Streptomyces griseocarneus]
MDLPPSLLRLDTYVLSKIGKTARARLSERLATRGLRLWHMAVLAALADFGPHIQRELASRLDLHPSDVAKVIDTLVAGGAVERRQDPADRRRVRVDITPAGRSLLGELEHEAGTVRDGILAPLNPSERAELSRMLHRVFDGLHAPGSH